MDRITESLLADFCHEHDLERAPQDKQFELFSGFSMIRRHYRRTFDVDDVWVGGGNDTGIDAIAIVANNILITDVDMVHEAVDQNGYLDVSFVFVQADRGEGFDGAKLGNFEFGVKDFFVDKPSLPRNSQIILAAEIMAAIYSYSGKFRSNPTCTMYYVTTGRWTDDPNLVARRNAARENLMQTKIFSKADVVCVGADELQEAYKQTKNFVVREFTFSNRTDLPETPGVTQAFLGFVNFSAFKSIISDDSGNEILTSMFYDNVRDWQEYNPVNTGIQNTLRSDAKSRFVLMNNGVTIIARSLKQANNRFTIEDFQIVNGCQTSNVIFNERDGLDDTVSIPLRLIETRDESVIEAIIQATNSQTKVKEEQFYASRFFSKKLEDYYSSFSDPSLRLFYERRDGQYDRLAVEKTRIVTPSNNQSVCGDVPR